MADNNKVTIDAAWFAELFAKWERPSFAPECGVCKEVHTRTRERDVAESKCKELAKERDELKAALERANQTNSSQADQLRDALNALEQERMNKCDEVTAKSLAAAERCIEDVKRVCKNCKSNINGGNYRQACLNMDYCIDAIRAYREKSDIR